MTDNTSQEIWAYADTLQKPGDPPFIIFRVERSGQGVFSTTTLVMTPNGMWNPLFGGKRHATGLGPPPASEGSICYIRPGYEKVIAEQELAHANRLQWHQSSIPQHQLFPKVAESKIDILPQGGLTPVRPIPTEQKIAEDQANADKLDPKDFFPTPPKPADTAPKVWSVTPVSSAEVADPDEAVPGVAAPQTFRTSPVSFKATPDMALPPTKSYEKAQWELCRAEIMKLMPKTRHAAANDILKIVDNIVR